MAVHPFVVFCMSLLTGRFNRKPCMCSADRELSDKEKRDCYEDIARQIDREDGLTNHRLTWVLQINGFLFAALAFIGDPAKLDPCLREFLHNAVPLAGFSVSVAGLMGVRAAHMQLDYLVKKYGCLGLDKMPWPRPFGGPPAFRLGRAPTLIPPFVFLLVWVWFLLFVKVPGDRPTCR